MCVHASLYTALNMCERDCVLAFYVCVEVCPSLSLCVCLWEVNVCVSTSRRAKYCVKLSCGSPVENAPSPSRTVLWCVVCELTYSRVSGGS